MSPFKVAIAMKEDKIAFYRDAVRKCSHPVGRKMFSIILDDEERHLGKLKRMLAGVTADIGDEGVLRSAVSDAVESLTDDVSVQLACTLDEMEAFRLAMEKEKEAAAVFRRMAAEAGSEEVRSAFERLAEDEDEHYTVFSNTYSFLEDSGNWFMWKEYSIVEG